MLYVIALAEIEYEVENDICKAKTSSGSKKRKRSDDDEYAEESEEDNTSSNTSQGPGHACWHRIIEDYKLGAASRILHMLATLPPDLILALLHGDLPSRMQDAAFADQVGPFVELTDCPGIYAVFVSRSGRMDAGKGLTLNEMITVIKTMETYIDIGKQQSEELAREIDSVFGSDISGIDYKEQRRFGGGMSQDNFVEHRLWLRKLSEIYGPKHDALKGTENEYLLDEPMARCFAYIGMAQSPLSRAPHHWQPKESSSPLWALFYSTVRHLCKDKYLARLSTYQIFRSIREDETGLEEIVLTTLMMNLGRHGGLNYCWAGGALRSVDDQKIQKSLEFLREHDQRDANIQDAVEKLKRYENDAEREARLEKGQSDYLDCMEKTLEEVNKMKEEAEKLVAIAELSALQKAFADFEAA